MWISSATNAELNDSDNDNILYQLKTITAMNECEC